MSLPINGLVQIQTGTIYSPPKGSRGIISLLNFANEQFTPYTLEVFLDLPGKESRILYKVSLDAGDYLNDSGPYEIAEGGSIQARSNVSTVAFTVNGHEQ